ncbi:MAG: RNA polymerase sigma factor [Solirubrobacteraceae bacterium]
MALENAPDERLLEWSERTPEAFAVFYRRHERVVVAFLGRLSRDPQLTVDLTAETFARAYSARSQFDPQLGTARGWLLGIARHVLAASREQGRVQSEAREQLRMQVLRVSEQTLSSVERAVIEDGETVVEEWLSGLPDSERDAVRRRILEDASYEQIAAELACSQAVVRQRVSRGLSRLRRTAMEEQ